MSTLVLYDNGEEVAFTDCPTVLALRVAIAVKHHRFAPNVELITQGIISTAEDSHPAPEKVGVRFIDPIYTQDIIEYAIRAHTRCDDIHSLLRLYDDAEVGNIAAFYGGELLFRKDALHLAVRSNYSQAVSFLIRAYCNVNQCDDQGFSALYISAAENRVTVTRTLVSARADANICPEGSSFTPLHIACKKGYHEIIEELRNSTILLDGDNSSYGSNQAPLLLAVMHGQPECVRVLCDMQAAVHNVCDNLSILEICAIHSFPESVHSLVNAKCSVNTQNAKTGLSALHQASLQNNALDKLDVMMNLLACHADTNLCDAEGRTALHCAVIGANLNAAMILVERSCCVNIEDLSGAYGSSCRGILAGNAGSSRCISRERELRDRSRG